MVTESLEHDVLAKESSQLQSLYEATASLTEFDLKKILIDKMDKSESYMASPKHKECYEGLIKSYDLYKSLFSTYSKVYSLKRSQKDKDKDEDPSAGSDRWIKKRKTSKDAEPTKGPKGKESQSVSSKGTKSQSKSLGESVQSEEPEFEVADLEMPQDQEENLGNDDVEPKEKNVDKTPHQGQNQSCLMTLASSADKPSKTFDDLMSTPIDFFAFIMNNLKINNLTQETLLGPAFKLLKGTRSNYAKLEYDFEECYKALSKKLDWENPEGGDYLFDLTKPLPLVMSRNRQKVPIDYFFNNDLKYLQGGILTMTYMTSLTKTKAAQYDLACIEDMVPNIWVPYSGGNSCRGNEEIWVWVSERDCCKKSRYTFKEGDFKRLRLQDIEDMLLLLVQQKLTNLTIDERYDLNVALRMYTRRIVIQRRVEDLQLDQFKRKRLMRADELHKFSDGTLKDVRNALHDIVMEIRMEYLPMRKWSNLDKKRARVMVQDIDRQLYQRRLMRNLEKFIGGREYGKDLRLLEWTI
ncbi:hypothetical protein Tco_0060083 [Tanacetum coccineum]